MGEAESAIVEDPLCQVVPAYRQNVMTPELYFQVLWLSFLHHFILSPSHL